MLVCLIASTTSFAQWTVNTSGIAGFFQIRTLHFINNTTGFAGGTTNFMGGNGQISKTTNGGATWTIVKSIPSNIIYDIYFVNSTLGFAVGDKGLIAKTTDGGTTWSTQTFTDASSGLQEPLKSVYFVDQNIGYAAGGFNDQWVLKTTNGGTSWTKQNLPTSTFQRLSSIYFTNATTGYAVGGDMFGGGMGRLYATTNGGTTWDTLSTGVKTFFDDVYFTDVNTGFIGGNNGLILKTTNAGQSWAQKVNQDPDTDDIRAFSFVNANLGFACTIGGKILKTSDAGNTWTVSGNVANMIFSLYTISVPSQTFGITAGYGSFYAKTNSPTGLSGIADADKLTLYPNPASGNVFIRNIPQGSKGGSIKIKDMQGKEVFSNKLENNTSLNIELGHLNSGIYFVFIETEKGLLTSKLVLNK